MTEETTVICQVCGFPTSEHSQYERGECMQTARYRDLLGGPGCLSFFVLVLTLCLWR